MFEVFRDHLARNGTVSLDLKIRPGAHRTRVRSILDDECIKLDIAAAPEQGKANAELLRFLAEEFGVSRERIEIVSGLTSGRKRVVISA